MSKPSKAAHLLAPGAVMLVVLLMIVPLPPILLDLLLSIDIGLAVVLLLTAIYVKTPVEFSVFPSLLLLLTLLRLSLNVASTRLVLMHGGEGVEAAGNVIMAFDADLNAGIIDDREAKLRRERVRREADFYGSMDGAIRFTQRDSMAAVLITGVNIVAGLIIGVVQHGLDVATPLQNRTSVKRLPCSCWRAHVRSRSQRRCSSASPSSPACRRCRS